MIRDLTSRTPSPCDGGSPRSRARFHRLRAVVGVPIAFAVGVASATAVGDEIPSGTPIDLRANGAFGFDQARATVLCDTPELRFSVLSDGTHLFVQAVLWTDDDDTPGETADGRAIGDNATLRIAVRESGELTPRQDRSYSLDPWPRLAGLHYSVQLDQNSSTGLQGDSKGRGAIQFVTTADGVVRVDTMLIPLNELGGELGVDSTATIRLAYWGSSPSPRLIVNSVGFEREGQYWPHHLPRDSWHRVPLAAVEGVTIDPSLVPEGRGTIEIPAARPMPVVGSKPPEIVAEKWFNWNGDDADAAAVPSLESLRGQVVVVEFWATWCGPCIAGIPKLNEIHQTYGPKGMVLLALSDQSASHIEEWLAARTENRMQYIVGAGSTAVRDYGVRGIPAAFVIGRDGTIVWSGHPAAAEFEAAIKSALDAPAEARTEAKRD